MRRNSSCAERVVLLLALTATAVLTACDSKPDEKKAAGPPPTLVTLTQARSGTLELTEDTLGTLESVLDPKVAAEVPGRVVALHVRTGNPVKKGQLLAQIDPTDAQIQARADEAEVKRLETLVAQQERVVQRQEQLVKRNFISQNALDDAIAQRNALREQIAVARARSDAGLRNVGKTRVVSPLDGFVEVQIASVGDYVKLGDPLFQLISNRKLRAHLPFPEAAAARLNKGLPVRITSPQIGGKVLNGVVTDIRPNIAEGARALDVIVDVENDGGLRGGGTVNASVLIARKSDVVLVPEQSVVLRPAGRVAYVIGDGKAIQREVQVGATKGGMVEIVAGLKAGETVALDGAGFLTHGAPVQLRDQVTGQSSQTGAKPGAAAAP